MKLFLDTKSEHEVECLGESRDYMISLPKPVGSLGERSSPQMVGPPGEHEKHRDAKLILIYFHLWFYSRLSAASSGYSRVLNPKLIAAISGRRRPIQFAGMPTRLHNL